MTAAVQDELRTFVTRLLERQGGLVEWPHEAKSGEAIVDPKVARHLGVDGELVPLSFESAGEAGLLVNLAGDFLQVTGQLLESEPRVAFLRARDLYLKQGQLDDAVARAFTWLNARVKVGEVQRQDVAYHTWWFYAVLASEDRWETRFSLTLDTATGSDVELPDPLTLWDVESESAVESHEPPDDESFENATRLAQARTLTLAESFIARMDQRRERDRKRLSEYYRALLREAAGKRNRKQNTGDAEQIEAKKRAVQLELRRKLVELDERFAMEVTLRPIVLLRTTIPVLVVTLNVFRKQAQRSHSIVWNPLLKQFEPLRCSRCTRSVFTVAFANETVAPLCITCAG